MKYWGGILAAGLLLVATSGTPAAAGEPLFISVGDATRAPVGWAEFCTHRSWECNVAPTAPRAVVLTSKAWKQLVRINRLVNTRIRPMTDLEHWGVVEKWSYPDDGYGDCEDYVLLKRRMLMEAGWPREALLITVVRDQKNEGHAVLTVKTDQGEFVLDNQNEEIVTWAESGYRFVKRQSQSDPNAWVSLGDPRAATATATSR
jgi:predicted transglutaminase-like cysteine proteinase